MEVLELPQFTIIEQRLVSREVVFTTGEFLLKACNGVCKHSDQHQRGSSDSDSEALTWDPGFSFGCCASGKVTSSLPIKCFSSETYRIIFFAAVV